jgi:hypothetical protein
MSEVERLLRSQAAHPWPWPDTALWVCAADLIASLTGVARTAEGYLRDAGSLQEAEEIERAIDGLMQKPGPRTQPDAQTG